MIIGTLLMIMNFLSLLSTNNFLVALRGNKISINNPVWMKPPLIHIGLDTTGPSLDPFMGPNLVVDIGRIHPRIFFNIWVSQWT